MCRVNCLVVAIYSFCQNVLEFSGLRSVASTHSRTSTLVASSTAVVVLYTCITVLLYCMYNTITKEFWEPRILIVAKDNSIRLEYILGRNCRVVEISQLNVQAAFRAALSITNTGVSEVNSQLLPGCSTILISIIL